MRRTKEPPITRHVSVSSGHLHTFWNENKKATVDLRKGDSGSFYGYKVELFIDDKMVKEIHQFETTERYAEDTAENFVMGWGHFELDDHLD